MIYETILTDGNFGKSKRNHHIYIKGFVASLPIDIVGGSTKRDPAPRLMTLEHDGRRCETDIPTDKRTGRPRPFFRERKFIGEFFERTDAKPGDVVIFEHLAPYHLRMSLRRR